MQLLALLLPVVLVAAQKKGGGSGNDNNPDQILPQTSAYTITHTYTYNANYYTFFPSPACSRGLTESKGTTSTEIVVQATDVDNAEDLVEDMVKTMGLPTPTRNPIPTVGTIPAWVTNTAVAVDGACTAVITGARQTTASGSGAALVTVVGSGKAGWVLGGAVVVIGGLMIGL